MRFADLSQWLSWLETAHPKPIELGLERVAVVLQRLGWQRPQCPVVTVSGTNGKGSCVALLESLLRHGGYRVGCYTSPHLRCHNEMIGIAAQSISDAALIAAFERIDAARGDVTLTSFEFFTLAALLEFATAALDAIVLEVGMGGRRDAVNIVDADVALISSVALDHCQWLGADVEAIGYEKAGIFRPGRPAVLGARCMPKSIAEYAASIGAPLMQLGHDFDYRGGREGWDWIGARIRHDALPPPALAGAVQFENAASVLAVLDGLRDRLPLSRDAIVEGLAKVRLSGRFQRIMLGCEWILDVAHNPAAAEALAAQLDELPCSGSTFAIIGMLADKDIVGTGAALDGHIDGWIVGGLTGDRAAEPELVARDLLRNGAKVITTTPTMGAACAVAQRLAAPADRVLAFGSFRTVKSVLDWMDESGLSTVQHPAGRPLAPPLA